MIRQPSKTEGRTTSFPTEDGSTYRATLTIIEWKIEIERALYLCTENGFTLREMAPGIHAPNYRFTAYLHADPIRLRSSGTIPQVG